MKKRNIEDRIINLNSIEEIDKKLVPIFKNPKYNTYIVNMSMDVANFLMSHYQDNIDDQPEGFIRFVKSLRQRECYLDGTAWDENQRLDFIIDSFTEEILQGKIGRPTDKDLSIDHCYIDDTQTRMTHMCGFRSNNKNYQFKASQLRNRIDNDKNNNLDSWNSIKSELNALLDYMESDPSKPKFSYKLLKLPRFKKLKSKFDGYIISDKLSFKSEAYLTKAFISDNKTNTTLTTDQILIAKGSILPEPTTSWTENVRPLMNQYNGRIPGGNVDNIMFNGSRKNPLPFAKKAWRCNGKKDIGQTTSFFMNLTLGFQDSNGDINLRKKLWMKAATKNADVDYRRWRALVHTTDTSNNSPHEMYLTKCFYDANLMDPLSKERYMKNYEECLKLINIITSTVVDSKKIMKQLTNWKNIWDNHYTVRSPQKDDYKNLGLLRIMGLSMTENAHLFIHELIRISKTYKINITETFIVDYLKSMVETAKALYNTDVKVNELGDWKATTYEPRLEKFWVPILENTELNLSTNPKYTNYFGGKVKVKDKYRKGHMSIIDRAYENLGLDRDEFLYIDSEWNEYVNDTDDDGHVVPQKKGGSAHPSESVFISKERNRVVGAKTRGNTYLPKPEVLYASIADGNITALQKVKVAKTQIDLLTSSKVLEEVSRMYRDGDVDTLMKELKIQ